MTDLKLNIPKFRSTKRLRFQGKDGYLIEKKVVENQLLTAVDKAGLISPGKHLLRKEPPQGSDEYFAKYNRPEHVSDKLIILKN